MCTVCVCVWSSCFRHYWHHGRGYAPQPEQQKPLAVIPSVRVIITVSGSFLFHLWIPHADFTKWKVLLLAAQRAGHCSSPNSGLGRWIAVQLCIGGVAAVTPVLTGLRYHTWVAHAGRGGWMTRFPLKAEVYCEDTRTNATPQGGPSHLKTLTNIKWTCYIQWWQCSSLVFSQSLSHFPIITLHVI